LLWVVNQNTITPHVWGSRVPDLAHPDIIVFDLDPPDEGKPELLRAAAVALRDLLEELGLPSWIKTTGSKGFHICVPLDGKTAMGDAAGFAHAVGRLLVERYPKQLTLEFYKHDRAGRILVDTGRNDYSATFAAAYAVRPKKGAPVSAPCTWDEAVTGEVGPRSLTLENVPARVAKIGDVWADMRRRKRSLAPAIAKLRKLTAGKNAE
jgi:bifunctional non-homologous end joining protein LigD